MMAACYEFEVSMKDITPRIWRRFSLLTTACFSDLHDAIQQSFGWDNCHLWEFRASGRRGASLAGPSGDSLFDMGDDDTPDADRVKLSSFFTAAKQSCEYVYDFGDSWHHEVKLKKIFEDEGFERQLLGGARACPPEDCGGVWGYERAVSFFQTGKDEDGDDPEDLKEWLGDWEPEAFDLKEAKEAFDYKLKKVAAKATSGKTPAKKATAKAKKKPAKQVASWQPPAKSAKSKTAESSSPEDDVLPDADAVLRAMLQGLSKDSLIDLLLTKQGKKK